jgi:hypothetical protein
MNNIKKMSTMEKRMITTMNSTNMLNRHIHLEAETMPMYKLLMEVILLKRNIRKMELITRRIIRIRINNKIIRHRYRRVKMVKKKKRNKISEHL